MTRTFQWRHLVGALMAASIAAAFSTTSQAEERKGFSAGIVLEAEATAKSVGLPIMPGAVRREKEKDEDHALTFAAWGGDFGFKVVVLGLSTTAQAGDVADYYKREMGRYGSVLDCKSDVLRKTYDRGEKKKVLVCDDKEKAGRQVLKVGTPSNYRLVHIDTSGPQVHINLVRVVTAAD